MVNVRQIPSLVVLPDILNGVKQEAKALVVILKPGVAASPFKKCPSFHLLGAVRLANQSPPRDRSYGLIYGGTKSYNDTHVKRCPAPKR